MGFPGRSLEIREALLGDDAGLFGALYLAEKRGNV
jgi:hypothetical protein